MQKIIRDLWIIDESGTVLWNRVFEKKVEEQMFGALMRAIDSFAREISDNGLSSFEFGNTRFTFAKKNNFIFIGNAAKSVKDKKVQKELAQISDKFFREYSGELNHYDNDISVFEGFEMRIEDSLEVTIDKFKQAFW